MPNGQSLQLIRVFRFRAKVFDTHKHDQVFIYCSRCVYIVALIIDAIAFFMVVNIESLWSTREKEGGGDY